ncbi:MAG: transcriptional regulator NrdR [Christensenellales bacterium]|jgi:transcriptional repressor NrdR
MKCMYCGSLESRVVDSRPAEDGSVIRRRRECEKCAKRFTTYEKVESLPLFVVKKDGRREPFNADKIKAGLVKACEKRPVAVNDIDAAVAAIEKQAYASLEQEIKSEQIGELVMAKLKKLDEVAYVRFASVYRQFKDINAFMSELQSLLKE